MTRLSLQETCLMELSGELGKKAQAQLHEHITKFPAALLEYELIRGQYEMLRAAPKVSLDDQTSRKIGDAIKMGVHRKLRQVEHKAAAQKRWKIVYAAMAGVTSVAACLLITGGIYLVHHNVVQQEIAANNAVRDLDEWNNTPVKSPGDEYRDVASDISTMEKSSTPAVAQAMGGAEMMNLYEALDAQQPGGSGAN